MTRKLVVNGARTLCTICVMLAVPAAAQNTASPATSGITLLDAVRYTLEHHPLIGEQKAQVTNNRGLTLQASAPVRHSSAERAFAEPPDQPDQQL